MTLEEEYKLYKEHESMKAQEEMEQGNQKVSQAVQQNSYMIQMKGNEDYCSPKSFVQ